MAPSADTGSNGMLDHLAIIWLFPQNDFQFLFVLSVLSDNITMKNNVAQASANLS